MFIALTEVPSSYKPHLKQTLVRYDDIVVMRLQENYNGSWTDLHLRDGSALSVQEIPETIQRMIGQHRNTLYDVQVDRRV